jgi:predicted DNA-binding protein (MmcQ/YjbR family)
MDIDRIRKFCLSLPCVTEQVQWEDDLLFKVGAKMFAVVPLEPGPRWLAFKCTDEEFAELVERPGIIPAPYLARAHWVSLENEAVVSPAEIQRLLRQARDLVFAKLPKKTQSQLLRRKPRKIRKARSRER